MSFTFQNPFAYFNNPANSNPVGLGNLYVGLPDTDPITPANQIPVYAVQPDGSELQRPQPVRMTAGGVLTYNGTPIQIRTDADTYAIKTTSSTGAQLYYAARVQAPDSGVRSGLADGSIPVDGQPASTLSYDVLKYGAIADLTTAGDTNAAAFNEALANSRYVTAKNGVYYVSDTIEMRGVTQLDLPACTIVATGMAGKPIFRVRLDSPTVASEQISIRMGGGSIIGDAAYVFEFVGVDTSPSPVSEYARIIKIDGVTSSSSSMRFMNLTNAVKSLHISNVWHFGGMFANTNGKVVETHIVNSVIFGSGTDENGFLFESNGGTNNYSEGLHVSNSTIDGYINCFNIRDMFVTTLVSAYIGGTKSFFFRPPTTTHNREFSIGAGCVFAGRVVFEDSVGGVSGNGKISGAIFSGAAAPVIEVGSGWSNIDIENTKAETNGGPADVAVLVKNGCNDININGLNADVTFGGGVVFSGVNGDNCRALNVNSKLGRSITSDRPIITKNPSLDGVSDVDLHRYQARLAPSASVAVGQTFGFVPVILAKGQTGYVQVSLLVAGCAANQTLQFDDFSNLSVPGDVGWNSGIIQLPSGDHYLNISVPFIAKQNISTNIGIVNVSGNTVAQSSDHAFVCVVKDL